MRSTNQCAHCPTLPLFYFLKYSMMELIVNFVRMKKAVISAAVVRLSKNILEMSMAKHSMEQGEKGENRLVA